jgi:hypothetical protein
MTASPTLATPSASPASLLLERARAARDHIYRSGALPDEAGTPLPVWPSGVTQDRGAALRDLALSVRAATCIETGFGYGMSASFILDAALQVRARLGSGLPPAVERRPPLTSMDPGEWSLWKNAGLVHLDHAGLRAYHRFFAEGSERVLPRLLDAGETFDFAFIDGDHRFDGAMIDTFYMLRFVRPGGLIVLDDAWMPSVQKCSAFFVNNGLCELVSVWPRPDKHRLHALRPIVGFDHRVWDHFVVF